MCGRFTRMYTWRELVRLYRLTDRAPPSNLQPRYNICPTTTIDAVIEREGKRKLEQMRWGLVPSWWNKALQRYEALRLPRATHIQGMATANRTRFHLPDGPAQIERDTKMAQGGTDWSIKAIAWIYGYDSASAVDTGDLGLPP